MKYRTAGQDENINTTQELKKIRTIISTALTKEHKIKHRRTPSRLEVHLTPTYLQQDDSAKNFFMDIGNEGLRFAWAKYFIQSKSPETKTDAPKNIVIVGAGFAGLSAAYELSQVSILELQNRVGGRAKTIYDGFSEGLHAEGGAMRLPLVEHFMTNHYIRLLGVPIRKFQNTNETNKTWINLFGKNIRMQDWEDNNLEHLKEFYPEAASFIESRGLQSIDELYEKTLEPVKKDLEKDTSAEGWEKWVERWSKYSVESFFRDGTELNEKELRPWPEDAIQAYKVTAYAPITNRSLAETMREDLGKWWSDDLWTPVAGMQSFAETFMERSLGWHKDVSLTEHINYGKKVDTIKVNQDGILVSGRCSFTGREFSVSGDAGIVTLPLPVLRQITIQDETGGKNIFAVRKVLSNVHYDASTKILLQCKSRFWEKDLGNGGFSRTNLPIGQIHYPSNENRHPNTDRAILLSYTWGQDAIMLGAQSEQEAVASAVRQLKHIHPEIEQYFEVGRVQAWTRDPSAQLAFVNLNPNQYKYSMETLLKTDTHPLHIAGEALSWSHGWIQGALESGLRAAYNIFCKYEKPILGQRKL
ncbi:hypothetical protein FSP39_009068 [Pinctada imbricata]|uniref:Amine oxidase domain-containing protein n=1 Tax=Pinctada imbricata TaxID=66713 RepID=A0AA88Y7T8_PINIB|nr:hypothetical protein FSP39_009068 [Pinctada imbricata]